ncbi:MAG: tRNA uridine(34) 5-carboxymethylaminomethyl modification radical SAM/GNAT enzyme Elp3 [Methanobacteriaceae archaeon]|nr:tRNA uridine(34) 5-carboxymethylaminomethyl modification radical SAM/GNAT enzyme Elp3 [Methanobacteriaceae archaeon]
MESACRLIIEEIVKGKIKTREELENLKRRVCNDLKLKKFIGNSTILKYATKKERKIIEELLRKKPTRTISGVAIVAVMCQPHPCPHGRCLYCPESEKAPPSYTGEEPAALRARMYKFHPYHQVYNRLKQLHSIGHPTDKVELIIMGGTFPSQTLCYQEWFITQCLKAMIDFGANIKNLKIKLPKYNNDYIHLKDVQSANEKAPIRCVGLTFETRPDYCKEEDVDRMLSFGVTRVELGVQTIYNHIYQRIKRGHNIQDVIESNRILRDSGIKVAMHLMPGLFADFEKDLRIFKRLFSDPSFKPDMIKIYPCLVTKNSQLYHLWEKGEYKPYNTEEAAELIVQIKKMLPKWVRTMRIQRDIPSHLIVDGVKKSNLGEIVYKKLEEEGIQCQCIRCREIGHRLSKGASINPDNIKPLKESYKATGGKEFFLSYEDTENNILIGFLRLRLPSKKAHRREINEKTALVRELHVYGPMLPLGEPGKGIGQHSGYGEKLLSWAEELAIKNNKEKILITSGIGVRNYYKRLGYEKEGPYMAKVLK